MHETKATPTWLELNKLFQKFLCLEQWILSQRTDKSMKSKIRRLLSQLYVQLLKSINGRVTRTRQVSRT